MTRFVIREEKQDQVVTVELRREGDDICILVGGYYALTLLPSGVFKRVMGCHSSTGLQTDDKGRPIVTDG